jgi:hypothetical protein
MASETIKQIVKTKTDLNLINEIQEIRAQNNIQWMAILKLSMQAYPKETKKILQKINKYDSMISKKTKELSNG